MIKDLKDTIFKLLTQEYPLTQTPPEIDLNFDPPDAAFKAKSKPAINLFLYDIREDLESRASEYITMQRAVGAKVGATIRQPINVRCSYMITAWSDAGNSTEEEHTMLGKVIAALYRHPTIPKSLLQGDLVKAPSLPRAILLQPSELKSMGEFWSAMGGQPRPAIHYAVTFPFPIFSSTPNVSLVETVHIDHNANKP